MADIMVSCNCKVCKYFMNAQESTYALESNAETSRNQKYFK